MEPDFMQLADLFMTYNARPATVMADDDGMHHDPDPDHHGHDHKWYIILREDIRTTRRLKLGGSRMLQSNLEYT